MNERAFIARVEAANTDELIQILRQPGADETRVLRLHLGSDRYERLRQLALRSAKRGAKKGNVVVLHGIMGGELTVRDRAKDQQIWMNFPRLIIGGAGWLRMRDDSTSQFDVRATGILKKWYSEMLLGLAEDWDARAFWYDWRLPLDESARALRDQINAWFTPGAPVHFVAHSMGGLVCRTFILNHGERWEKAWDAKGNGLAGGRLIMLGTPNHGSFAIPQICTGTDDSVRKLVIADLKHNASELLAIVNTFPGSYQMMPSPHIMPAMTPLYRAETYGAFAIPQRLLDAALQSHDALLPIVDRDRMHYLAGCNQRTFDDIRDMGSLASLDAYSASLNGDGTVPHRLGFLEQNGKRIPTNFVEAQHGALPNTPSVIAATLEIMSTGKCTTLPENIPPGKRGVTIEPADLARARIEENRLAEIAQKTRARTRGGEPEGTPVSADEKEGEQIILRQFLSDPEPSTPRREPAASGGEKADVKKVRRPSIEIALVKENIELAGTDRSSARNVDAIAVGHYIGVKPQAAELAIDHAISAALHQKNAAEKNTDPDLLLTLFTERGLIRGNLGQPFILPDPRDRNRVIVLAGMGATGQFGVPELTVLAQELCWSLGRIGKRHLACVLIGAGPGNLSIADAVGAWLRGIRRALGSSAEDAGRQLRRITFVERDARTLRLLDLALQAAIQKGDADLAMHYQGPSPADLKKAHLEARADALRAADAEFSNSSDHEKRDPLVPVRLTIGLDRNTYRFAALTQTASVPQRDIPLDPRIVNEANDELAAAATDGDQSECGRFLERLLIPEDIRGLIYTSAPLVLMLDAATARVHWEMIARTEIPGATNAESRDFLGTSYGLTRQLRTNFAPTPEPPPPPKRVLKVLIVADPAEDAPLPGAQAEGEEVAATFERFNTLQSQTGHSVEVTRLFGPAEAKRTTVMKKLMMENFDVLHFAGHCVYDQEDPTNSGWIFSMKDDERLTANELQRIDRVPKFIFSNACESGITPDRSEQRTADLAPTFAEAFFARGVANFVCTAWPVDDDAARTFAGRLYSELLGLAPGGEFAFMHEAMREARLAITGSEGGARTWGAYQHYGNPYFRFFNPTNDSANEGLPKPKKTPRAKRPASKRKRTPARKTR